MSPSDATTARALTPEDLGPVVAIDAQLSGRKRQVFFQKRLDAALANPRGFLTAATDGPDGLTGFAIARIQSGEFGTEHAVAVLDVIDVATDAQHHGVGRALMAHLDTQMLAHGVTEMRTQAPWSARSLLRFFEDTGFTLAPYHILDSDLTRTETPITRSGAQALDAGVPDYSDTEGDDFDALSRDIVPVRSMTADDLSLISRIDARITGLDRTPYFKAKFEEAMRETGIRVSLIAEADGTTAGFIMARVDFGDFGRAEPTAVIDTIGVDPRLQHHGAGQALMSQLMANLSALQVDAARTMVRWDDFGLLKFFELHGFRPSQNLVFTRAIS